MPTPFSWRPKRVRFCEEYLVDLNGAAAARRAGYSEKTARITASELLAVPEIAARIAELQAARSERTQVTVDAVIDELWALATADPRELIEYRVGACRHCYGDDYGYQRTAAEYLADQIEWSKIAEGDQPKHRLADSIGEFDEKGGIGYDRTRPPLASCPECRGEGVGYTYVKDERALSRNAARLLAGVKETKEGIEVKMHDPRAALVDVGKHLGMFKDRVEHSGPNGAPIAQEVVVRFVAPASDAGD